MVSGTTGGGGGGGGGREVAEVFPGKTNSDFSASRAHLSALQALWQLD